MVARGWVCLSFSCRSGLESSCLRSKAEVSSSSDREVVFHLFWMPVSWRHGECVVIETNLTTTDLFNLVLGIFLSGQDSHLFWNCWINPQLDVWNRVPLSASVTQQRLFSPGYWWVSFCWAEMAGSWKLWIISQVSVQVGNWKNLSNNSYPDCHWVTFLFSW